MSRSIHHRHYKLLLAHLRELREAAGITQAALAQSLGRTQGHISKIECGDRRMDALPFVEICEALGPHVTQHFLAAKREEWREYISQVSAWELDRYLAKY